MNIKTLFEDKRYFFGLFVLCFGAHLWFVTEGWNLPILDHHDFRQTQTALASYWVVQEGFQLAYQLPVLGPPWSIPLEFPLYQWVVASVHMATGYPLDQTGRLISVLFFLAALPAAWLVARHVFKKAEWAWLFLCLVLVNPVHLFWARAFMIETTVLCLGTWFLWFFIRSIEKKRVTDHVLAILLGCLAGLVKPTTYIIFLVAAFFIYLKHFMMAVWPQRNRREIVVFVIRGAVLVLISIAVVWLWTHYADGIKSRHPYQPLVSTSDGQHRWNYGTWEQRMDRSLWERALLHFNGWFIGISPLLGAFGATFVLGVILSWWVASGRRLLLGGAILLSALSTPLVFFNVFQHHDYYQMAVTGGLCFFVVLPFISLMERQGYRRLTKFIVVPGFCLLLLIGYSKTYYYQCTQRKPAVYQNLFNLANYIKQVTDQKRDVVMIFTPDEGWTSRYAYLMQRKTRTESGAATLDRFQNEQFYAMEKAIAAEGMRLRAVVSLKEKMSQETIDYLSTRFNTPGKRSSMNGPVLLFDAE